MKSHPNLLAPAVLLVAMIGTTAARATEIRLLDEGFDNVNGLAGWTQVNASTPAGSNWFQGNAGLFPAQAGAADSYAAANFLGAQNGSGTVDNWLITPVLALTDNSVLRFFTRTDTTPGYNDYLEVRFAAGTGSDPADFTRLLTSIGGADAYPADWQGYTANVAYTGNGRFAFRYTGSADSLNYVGLDSVSVDTTASAVPEPGSLALLALGLGLAGTVRRATRRHQPR